MSSWRITVLKRCGCSYSYKPPTVVLSECMECRISYSYLDVLSLEFERTHQVLSYDDHCCGEEERVVFLMKFALDEEILSEP